MLLDGVYFSWPYAELTCAQSEEECHMCLSYTSTYLDYICTIAAAD